MTANLVKFDPRSMATPVYKALTELRKKYENDNKVGGISRLKEQKNQAVELYTYLSTWGMLRLKAEEQALSQEGKRDVVNAFFTCLNEIAQVEVSEGEKGLKTLTEMDADNYLGLLGVGLELSQEFSFWAMAVYHDIKGGE